MLGIILGFVMCDSTNAADHAIVSEQIFYEEVKQ